ncbi:MAG TPA: chemotaxis protein CheA [Polyangiales bacterium]|nr:chemotaxis protein CheA [Polyangiales bacterium]
MANAALDSLQKQLMSTFFDEATEALGVIESRLLELDKHAGDPRELIDEVFRAAHSIKGGAGTFGLSSIAELAHVAETLLDRLRSGRCSMSSGVSAVLLESVDVLRHLLTGAREHTPTDARLVSALKLRLERAIVVSAAPPPAAAAPRAATEQTSFTILFRPHANMLRTGNDAARLLRELALLGSYEIETDTRGLPRFDDLDPTLCYLAFAVRLQGAIAREQIDEVFSWVGEDADIEVDEATARAAPPPTPTREFDGSIGSIRVAVDKVDLLMNMVGELVITQSILGELDSEESIDAARLASLRDGLSLLARNTRALQESVMSLRSMPIGTVFARLPRLVHDTSKQLGKLCELRMSGQSIEVDKTILEKLGDPLVHLIRNALDHGIESPEKRRAAGKPETGTLEVAAFHRGSDFVVELSDDGGGLNLAKIAARGREMGLIQGPANPSAEVLGEMIFAPGFSTASAVSDVSGRGVGMDVVRRNIKSLSGHIHVSSTPGAGTRISLRLPLTLAIIDGQLVSVGGYTYVVPLLSILESVQVDPSRVHQLEGKSELYRLRDELVPIVDLRRTLGLPPMAADANVNRLLVVVEADGERIGLSVEELLAQQQVVVKSLETNYGVVEGLAGATILGDGRVALILDVMGIARLARRKSAAPVAA